MPAMSGRFCRGFSGEEAGPGWTMPRQKSRPCGGRRPAGSSGRNAWPAPYALGYGKFTALARALGERAGDGRAASLRDVADAASVCEHNAVMNLTFLEGVGVVHEEARGAYRLTEAGRRYAGAHLSGRPGPIEKETRSAVRASHLRRLADESRVDAGMRHGELLLRIKYAGRPDGPGAGSMQWPASTGARALLRVLGDAGMLLDKMAARPEPPQGGKHAYEHIGDYMNPLTCIGR